MTPCQMTRRTLANALVATTLVACQGAGPRTPLSPAQPERPVISMPSESGTIRLAIRWPGPPRAAQLIPDSTRIVDLRVIQGGQTIATASLRFPATELVLGPVPTGASTLEAEAFHAPLPPEPASTSVNLVATGSVDVLVLPNRNVNAALNLAPTRVPVLDSLEPAEGPAGGDVKLRGRLLKAPSGGDTVVTINGTLLASSSYSVFDESLIIPELPDLGDNLTLRLVVDGVAGNRSLIYRVIRVRGLSISPSTLVLQPVPGSDEHIGNFTATAYRDANRTSPLSDLPSGLSWDIIDEDPPRSPTGASIFEIRDSTVLASGTTAATATVTVQYGSIEATASVVYNPD